MQGPVASPECVVCVGRVVCHKIDWDVRFEGASFWVLLVFTTQNCTLLFEGRRFERVVPGARAVEASPSMELGHKRRCGDQMRDAGAEVHEEQLSTAGNWGL